ncbi:MAG: DUF2652 domain-containing protein [Thermodesulfobacteriota bacterium]
MSQKGYLVIADISGYTAFLTHSELDHAEGIMKSLIKTLLEHLKSPFVVSKLEGDAIFVYAPDGSFVQGQTLLEAIENIYCSFAKTLESMNRDTTCTCKACKLMPTLDLKFIMHHGTFILSDIAGRQELTGPDVILVHNLLKNKINETLGVKAYAFFSRACADAMSLGELAEEMKTHTENYEHLGEVSGYVHDLHKVWDREREQRRVYVDPEHAWFVVEADVPVQPALAWDYLNKPELRRHWIRADSITTQGGDKGRLGVGSEYHCAHGELMVIQTIVDWKPFNYMTVDTVVTKDQFFRLTTKLTPIEKGTRVSWYFAKLSGTNPFHTLVSSWKTSRMKGMLTDVFTQGGRLLREMIEADQAAGKVVVQL